LITKHVASLSVRRRSPILADNPAARSSAPDFAGDLDGNLLEPEALADELDGETMETP
jgi:hypothetical protein